jgi:hypothetical protein
MAQSPGSKKTTKAKLSRSEKATARKVKRAKRRETFSSLLQAFKLTRENDPLLVLYVILAFLVPAAVVFVVLMLLISWWVGIVPAILLGVLAALFVFSRRAQTAAYGRVEGQPGAAVSVLGQLRGDWRKTDGVAATAQFDIIHRVLGRPGIILIGEGSPQRVRALIAQEKKRVSRLAGDAPIYDVVVGREEGEVPLGKLNTHIMKLPRNLSKEQVVALDRRLAALNAQRAPLPQGPMPAGVRMRNVQRAARRRG